MFWKRRIIEDADVDCRLCINVFFAMFKAVIHAAEISNGTFWPVVVIVYLHFQVYLLVVIYGQFDIKPEFFITERGTNLNGISDFNRSDLFWVKVE